MSSPQGLSVKRFKDVFPENILQGVPENPDDDSHWKIIILTKILFLFSRRATLDTII